MTLDQSEIIEITTTLVFFLIILTLLAYGEQTEYEEQTTSVPSPYIPSHLT